MNATRCAMSRATGLITSVVLISALGMSGLTISDANAQDAKRRMSTGSTSSANSRTAGRQLQRTNSRTSIGVSPRLAGANSAKRGQRRARGRSASDVSDGAPDWENSSVQPPPSRNPIRVEGPANEERISVPYRGPSSRSLMQQLDQSAATAPPPTPPPLPPGTPQQAREAQNTGTVNRASRGRSASDVSDGAPDWENSSVQPPPSRSPIREMGEAPEEDRAALYRNSSSRSLMQQQAQSAATAPPPTPPPLPPGTPQQARQAQNTGTVSRTSSGGSQMTFSRRPSK